jgi:hypothetical protein
MSSESSTAESPIPECINITGVLTAPAERTTSLAAVMFFIVPNAAYYKTQHQQRACQRTIYAILKLDGAERQGRIVHWQNTRNMGKEEHIEVLSRQVVVREICLGA